MPTACPLRNWEDSLLPRSSRRPSLVQDWLRASTIWSLPSLTKIRPYMVAAESDFAGELPKLLPHNAEVMQKYFAAPEVAEVTAMRNGTLQGAYLIVAARALGLDCGPMSGFDNAGVDKVFFSGTRIQSNFICSIGYGDPASVFPRNPRLSFEEAGRWA